MRSSRRCCLLSSRSPATSLDRRKSLESGNEVTRCAAGCSRRNKDRRRETRPTHVVVLSTSRSSDPLRLRDQQLTVLDASAG